MIWRAHWEACQKQVLPKDSTAGEIEQVSAGAGSFNLYESDQGGVITNRAKNIPIDVKTLNLRSTQHHGDFQEGLALAHPPQEITWIGHESPYDIRSRTAYVAFVDMAVFVPLSSSSSKSD